MHRGDMEIYNEPTEYSFWVIHRPEVEDHGYTDPQLKTYTQVKQELLRARQQRTVFVKDISYAAYDSLYKDDIFLQDPDIEFCFFNKRSACLSYFFS